jgi:hypothetical protein
MRRALSVVAILFALCNPALADLYAPFSGANLKGLTRNSTIAEYDSTVHPTLGTLLDLSGSNYFTYSEQFDNAAWTKSPGTASITANNTKAPDGTTTADLFVEGTAGSGDVAQSVQLQPAIGNGTYTISVYAKYKTSGKSWVYIGCAGAANKYAWFNIQNGVVGTVQSLVSAYKIQPIIGGWYRISVTTTDTDPGSTWVIRAASADNATTYTGAGAGAMYIWGAQLAQNDVWRVGPGVYHQTVAANKPLLDMTAANAPTESKASLQAQDGRQVRARTFNGANQQYSVAHNSVLNVFDTDHTVTIVAASSAETNIFGRFSLTPASGGGIRATSVWEMKYVKLDGSYTSNVTGGAGGGVRTDGRYHVHQLVRTGNTAVLYTDGLGGAAVDVSNAGIDLASGSFYVAGVNGVFFNGSIAYFRLDTEALSQTQLAKEREQIQGTLFGSGNLNPGSTFSRASAAAKPFSDGTFGYATTNIPRVGGDGGGVLIEEQRSNILTYSENQANAAWGVTNLTNPPVAYIGTDPAGTTTGYVLAEDGTAAAEHKIARSAWVTVTAGTTYTLSAYVKAINRDWTALHIYENGGTSYYAYFNVAKGTIGTTSGGPTTKIEQLANGWYRCSVTHAIGGGITQIDTAIYVAEADNDWTFNGATQSSLAVFGAQMEVGAHASSYIPTTSAAVTRYADDLTIEPWKVTKPGVGTPNFAMYFDNDVYNTGTYTSEIGNYTFTVAGDTKHVESQTLGDYFSFDGTGDYLSLANGSGGSDFNPSGNFSVAAIVTPSTIAAGQNVICSKWSGAAQRGWMLYRDGAAVSFIRSTDGTAGTQLNSSVASALVAGKTSLVTGTYSTTTGLSLRVDALPADSDAATGTVFASTASFYVGVEGDLSNALNGKIHYLTFINHGTGAVLTQAQHDAMYANLKQANILPVKIGNSYEAKKLFVEFDAKCNFANKTEAKDAVFMFEISGNTGCPTGSAAGCADANSNRILLLYGSDGKLYFEVFADSESTERYMLLNTVQTDMNRWHSYKAMYDFSNLANSVAFRDSTAFDSTGDLSGAKNFDFTNTKVRVNQDYAASMAYSGCTVRNLRIRATP